MTIDSELVFDGKIYKLKYSDADSFDELPRDRCKQIYAVCFLGDKFVIGWRGKKRAWGLIGGTIEKGEIFEEALTREIREESNMRILKSIPVGYQKVTTPSGEIIYQLRSCCFVEPIGEFVSDPDGNITEIKLVTPENYKTYFDWGAIGDRIITRAVELKHKLI